MNRKIKLRNIIRNTLKNKANKRGFFVASKKIWDKYKLLYFFKQLYKSSALLQKSKIISSYYPLKYEINCLLITKWLNKHNHTIVLPKILNNTKELIFYEFNKNTILKKNEYGIIEPNSEKQSLKPDALLVPLIAFDNRGIRLGQGGGYYDYTINKLNNTKKVMVIGLGYSYQEVNYISKDIWDIKLDAIVTENYYKYFN